MSDRACCTSPVQAVRPRRAATTRFDDARRASSNHLLLSGKLLRGRAGEVHQGENLQLSLRLGRRAWAQKVCQLVEPAQIACAECAGCARVAGERRSRRATEIYVLITCSLPTRRAGARHAPQKSLCDSCRRAHVAAQAWRPATDTAKPLAVLRAHVWSMVPRRVPWQCMTACRIGVVLCVSVALERGWRGRNVHGDGIPVRPSCLYIISTICNRLDA